MAPDNIKIIEAEYNGNPTYLIAMTDKSGKPIKALKWVMDGNPVWTNRIEMAWHQPSRQVVEEAFLSNFDPDYQKEQERIRTEAERERLKKKIIENGL